MLRAMMVMNEHVIPSVQYCTVQYRDDSTSLAPRLDHAPLPARRIAPRGRGALSPSCARHRCSGTPPRP